jgi:uncharacterized glyoxalase superfamily protein PhnB
MTQELRIVLRAIDFRNVVAFYRDELQLRMLERWDNGPGEQGAVFEVAPGGLIEVLAARGGDPAIDRPEVTTSGVEIACEVEDVDGWHKRLRARGVDTADEISDKPWGHRSFSVIDPLGITVVLYSVISAPA